MGTPQFYVKLPLGSMGFLADGNEGHIDQHIGKHIGQHVG